MTIAGVGLIGGSLALAARRAGLVGEVVGLGRGAANLETARQRGIVDRFSHDPLEAARDADLLILAVPVGALAATARACAPALRAGAIVSDVGSVKAMVVREVEAVLPAGLSFVGAHPIAGTERSGAAAADADLFRGSRCILTPSARSMPSATAKIRALWEGLGMQVESMDAQRHDAILAWVSHLPHAIAFSFIHSLAAVDRDYGTYGGPSFRSLTRVVASSPEMWRDIFLANAEQIDAALGHLSSGLDRLQHAIVARDPEALLALLQEAQAAYGAWRPPGGDGA
ncbi:MAG: prephenate dehydrogenase/arogenate dehydrogenase family protein [Deltaproteobacteria bacterium]|nr:prephenate dehydrogenase/arogenate dehydrogenase family protein [Deltaproteobacteria bacterium]